MSSADLWGAVAIGFAAGMTSGMLGVGGGVLFVPALAIFLGLSQVGAEATSLLAIVPVALVGAWRQRGYGNVNVRDGLVIGLLSPLGVLAGSLIAHAISGHVLAWLFAGVQIYFAFRLMRRALRGDG